MQSDLDTNTNRKTVWRPVSGCCPVGSHTMSAEPESSRARTAFFTRRRVEILCALLSVIAIVSWVSFVVTRRLTTTCLDIQNRRHDIECSDRYPRHTVNLTGLKQYVNESYINADGLEFPPGSYWKAQNGSVFGCPCKIKTCVTKCCPQNKSLSKSITCTKSNVEPFIDYVKNAHSLNFNNILCTELENITVDHKSLYIIENKIVVIDIKENRYNAYLMDDGNVLTYNTQVGTANFWDHSSYCIDHMEGKKDIRVFVAPAKRDKNLRDNVLRHYAVLVSIPFTLATLGVYLWLPELKTVHGKALVSHVSCLTLAYLGLALAYWNVVTHVSHNVICTGIAFLTQFGLLGSFFWLNVMSYDLWCTFSGKITIPTRSKERTKFIRYSCYAWGAPTAITIISLIVDWTQAVPQPFQPLAGKNNCWFACKIPFLYRMIITNGKYGRLIFFYLPSGLLMTLNLMMFATTLHRLWNLSTSTRKAFPKDSWKNGRVMTRSDHRRFYMYLKLFVAMGLTWTMEILSYWNGEDSWIWVFGDLSNIMQGVMIFLFFVCNRRIINMIKKKLNLSRSLDVSSNSSRLSSETATSSIGSVKYFKKHKLSEDA